MQNNADKKQRVDAEKSAKEIAKQKLGNGKSLQTCLDDEALAVKKSALNSTAIEFREFTGKALQTEAGKTCESCGHKLNDNLISTPPIKTSDHCLYNIDITVSAI